MTDEGKFVIPGDELGFSEEFMPGNWAYEEEGGIYAAVSGKVQIDMKDRRINVVPVVSTPPQIKDGDVVIGAIWDVRGQIALLNIMKIKGVDRAVPGSPKGAVHISKAREGYVTDLSREFSSGDIIMAKVVDANREPVELTTSGKSYGVIMAACSKCNGTMKPFKNGLKCTECKYVESRKVSSEYGNVEV